MSSIFVNKSEFQYYIERSKPTALKRYDYYITLAGKAIGQELTIYDLSRLDDLELDVVKQRCGKV